MAMDSRCREAVQKALVEFSLWFEVGMKHSVHNVLELKKANPPSLTNPVLRFVVPHAMSHVVERFVLEVEQAWVLLNQELRRQGARTLGVTNKDYRHLKKIRNKLVAHKIENSVATARYENWHKRTYGNFESVLALVTRVAARIHQTIQDLVCKRKLRARSVAIRQAPYFEAEDIEALLAAVKAHGIY
jgi:hypothetical protein